MKQLLLVTLLVCLSLSFGCAQDTDYTTEAAREPEMSNDEIERKIEMQLQSDPQLREANLTVDVEADRNWVTLSGTVSSEAMRTRAIELARAAHPGMTVDNKIQIETSRTVSRSEYTPEMARTEVERARSRQESIGDSLDDAWIHAKIVAQLVGDADTPGRTINVDVDRNVVTLRGTVETLQQKQEAERIAKLTDGVKRVNNQLRVSRG